MRSRRSSTWLRTTRGAARGSRGLRARPLRGVRDDRRVRARLLRPHRARRSRVTALRSAAPPFTSVNDDPNQYLFYTDPRRLYDCSRAVGGQADADALLPRLPAAPTSRTSSTSSTRLFLGYDMPPRDAGTRCPTRRSSTCCTSTCRSATATARWCARDRGALPGGVAASLPRVLPEISPQTSSCASASSSRTWRSSTSSSRPSEFVRDRYVDWGIPAEKIRVEPYGMLRRSRPVPEQPTTRPATASPSSGSSPPTRARTCCSRRWRSWARTSTVTSGSTAPTSSRSRPEFRERVRGAARGGRDNVTLRRAVRPRRSCRKLMAAHRLGGRALDLVGDRPARGAGGLPVRAAR